MFLNKRSRKLDREICGERKGTFDKDSDAVINAKANSIDQLVSQFDYDGMDKLNPEFSDYLWDKSSLMPHTQDVEIRIHSDNKLDEDEVTAAIKNHYIREYIVAKKEYSRSVIFALVMLALGVIAMGVTFLVYSAVSEFVGLILEIVTWVFVWEFADVYFIRGGTLRRKCRHIQKLYCAKVLFVNKDKNK